MKVIFSAKAKKELKKLGRTAIERIISYADELEALENPRVRGKGLVGNMSGYWRYRVEDYRLICRIIDDELIIEVVKVGHRSNVYL